MEVFHSFFGNETKKELELLKLLYKNKRFMGTEEISECLKMDRRSVYKYHDLLLNKPYMTKKEHMAVLSVKHGQGYKFNGSKKDYKILSRQVLQSNPFFELLETLLLDNKIIIAKFAYDNFVSESSVRKRMHELASLLEPMDFSLKKSKGTVHLIGKEMRIRFFMVAFFWRIFSGLHWPFTGISQRKCEKIVTEIYHECQIPVNTIELKLSYYVLAVTILRTRKGLKIDEEIHSVVDRFPFVKQPVSPSDMKNMQSIKNILAEKLSAHYHLDRSNIEFIFLWLYSRADFHQKNINTDCLADIDAHRSDSTLIEKIMSLYPQLIKKADTGLVDEEKKRMIFVTLYTGILSVEMFGKMDYSLTGYNLKEYLSLKFTGLLQQSEELVKRNKIYSKEPDKQEGLSLHVAVAWSMVARPISFSKKIKIKVETDLPFTIEQGIIERIQTTFQSYYPIEVSHSFKEENYDFCLSTAPITELEGSTETLLINAQVTLSDLLAIQKKLDTLIPS